MKTKIRKVGNSLGFTIPASIAKVCLYKVGEEVELLIEDGKLIIQKCVSSAPEIPSRPLTEMTREELIFELRQGAALSEEIIKSNRLDLISESTKRGCDVMDELYRRDFDPES